MTRMYALVCFADGDARVYRYDEEGENIEDLPERFIIEPDLVTHIEYGTDKLLLLKKAEMARSDHWAEYEPPDESGDDWKDTERN